MEAEKGPFQRQPTHSSPPSALPTSGYTLIFSDIGPILPLFCRKILVHIPTSGRHQAGALSQTTRCRVDGGPEWVGQRRKGSFLASIIGFL